MTPYLSTIAGVISMLNVNVIHAKNTQKIEVKPGQPTKFKVDPNTRFELIDSASGKAPVQIKARRAGDNLEIVTDEKAQIEDEALSNAQTPDLVLENYYKQADVSLFAGTGEEAVSYVPVDGAASSFYAAMTFNDDGTYSFDAGDAAYDTLKAGETKDVVVKFKANDGTADSAEQTLTITVTGTNDAPVVDADFGDLVSFEVSDVVLNPQVTSFLTAEQFEIIKSQYLSFMTIEAAGNLNDSGNLQWTFDSTGDVNTGFIPEGETLALNYTVKVTDSELAETTKVIHINILGTNAAPVIEIQEKDTAAASLVETNDVLSASGTLSLTDLDFNDPSTVTRIGVKVDGFDGGFDNDHFLGLLKLAMENGADGKPLLVGDPNNLRWTFKSSSKEDFDYLAQDEVLKLEYTIEAKDSHGATFSQLINVEIKGTNDAPLILTNIETDSAEATVDKFFKASGTWTVLDENVLTAKVANVKLFKGADASSPEVDVKGLKLEELLQTGGSFADTNELHNLTWSFVGDASKTNGLASGAYTLAYDIAISDQELTSHQTVNIHFQV
jgi:VCBS repeat-containing protein